MFNLDNVKSAGGLRVVSRHPIITQGLHAEVVPRKRIDNSSFTSSRLHVEWHVQREHGECAASV